MSVPYEHKASRSTQLGLDVALGQLDQAAQAAAQGWSYTHFLGYLLDGELRPEARQARLSAVCHALPVETSTSWSSLPSISGYRHSFRGRNIVLLGPPGVGKTHLAIGLGVLTAQLATGSTSPPPSISPGGWQRPWPTTACPARSTTSGPKLLIIDEVGYLSLEAHHASLLFQAICERYERSSPSSSPATRPSPTGARSSPATPSWRRPPWTASCTAPPSSTSAAIATGSRKSAERGPHRRRCHSSNPIPRNAPEGGQFSVLPRGSLLSAR